MTTTKLQQEILDVLDTVPDGPYWVSWGSVAVQMGRPRQHARAIATAGLPLNFPRWDQIRNRHGRYYTPAAVEYDKRRERDDALRARGVDVDADGYADLGRQLWPDGNGAWILQSPRAAVVHRPRDGQLCAKVDYDRPDNRLRNGGHTSDPVVRQPLHCGVRQPTNSACAYCGEQVS
jgi:alkylated DNA nucleotide flippase Atl1